MRPSIRVFTVCLATTALVSVAEAQQCDDFQQCTASDMCVDGECTGTPLSGSGCDDGNPCTVNDQCSAGQCGGEPAPNGTSCQGGCASCLGGLCIPDLSKTGQSCDDHFACTNSDTCQFGVCIGEFVQCPDTDDDICTLDFCNPATGQCEHFDAPPCPPCQACVDRGGGELDCVATDNGMACDDFNVCTGDGTCVAGECQAGGPVTPGSATRTPTASGTVTRTTATPTSAVATATSVATATAAASTPTPTMTTVATVTALPSATMMAATATSVPTATSAVVTPTPNGPTPTQPEPTLTQVPPTATLGAPTPTMVNGCAGDCDFSGEVSVDEIITAVNIALGTREVGDCTAADANRDQQVTVEEIIAAVNNALGGCSAAAVVANPSR